MPNRDPLDRCSLGVDGLDEILSGGLPRNRLYLIEGDPGAGKTTLAMQFLMRGADLGERCLYITLSETKEEIETVALSHGWSLDKIHLFELAAVEEKLKGETSSTFFHPSEVELNRTTQAFLDEIIRVNPSRLVFDSLSELRMLAEMPLRYRRQILQLKRFFSGRSMTVLFLDDRTSSAHDIHVESIAHGVITMQHNAPGYGGARRQLKVVKIRGSKFREGNHDFVIRTGGLEVFPRLVAAEHHAEFARSSIPSGISEFDALMGGGIDRGTSQIIMGPAGTGKSTLAMHFAHCAVQRGEHSLFMCFDETTGTLLHRVESIGINIRPHVKSGKLVIDHLDPAEISPGELASRIRKRVEQNGLRLVVIDSINGYLNAMSRDRELNLQLHEMLTYLNQQGVITVMVLAQHGLLGGGGMDDSVELSYLADTVILLRYFESRGSVRQAISIIKKRSGNHERALREFKISSAGVRVGEPLSDMHGVLTGVPSIVREPHPVLAGHA